MSILFNCEYDDFSVLKPQDTESPSQVTTTKIIITPTFQRKRPKPRKENAKINNPSRNLKIQFFFFLQFSRYPIKSHQYFLCNSRKWGF